MSIDARTAKEALRADLRARVAAVKPLVRALEEELVNAAVMGLPEWQAAQTVLLYKHKGPEFSVNSLANAAFRSGKQVCFPRVEGDRLVVHQVLSWDGLDPGAFGVAEPSPSAPVVAPEEVNLAVVPGLGWTEEGARLGQGGGFYDRLLPELAGTSVGVGFDCQVLPELPTEAHDASADQVWWAARIGRT